MLRKIAGAACCLISSHAFAEPIGMFTFGELIGSGFSARESGVIAASAKGDAAVAFVGAGANGTRDIYVSRLPAGAYLATPVERVNGSTAGDQLDPAIAMDAVGNFVIVWQDGREIVGQRYAANGDRVGGELKVTVESTADNRAPAVAMDAHGAFVVAWRRVQANASRIAARRYSADGVAIADPFSVSKPSGVATGQPDIGMSAWGEFVIVWEGGDSSATNVFFRSFGADGTAYAAESPVSGLPAQARRAPSVAMDAHGRFAVTWTGQGLDDATNIVGRQFLAGGSPAGSEILLSRQPVAQPDSIASIAMDASGDFVVLWSDTAASGERTFFVQLRSQNGALVIHEDGSGRYVTLTDPAVDVAVDADGDAFVTYPVQDHLAISRLTGTESIDLAAAITDDRDPAHVGETVRYTVVVSNHHAISTETGIPEVDQGIGFAAYPKVSVEGTGVFLEPSSACAGYMDGQYGECRLVPLGAGESSSLTLEARARSPGHASIAMWVQGGQFDDDSSNVSATEGTEITCPAGNDIGSIVVRAGPYRVEEGESVQIIMDRVGGTCGELSVKYGTDSGPDTAGAYGQLSWSGNEGGSRDIVVPTTEDALDEPVQSFEFAVMDPVTDRRLGGTRFEILDDDEPPRISLRPRNTALTEGAETAFWYEVRFSHGTEFPVSIPVNYAGAASRGVDYSGSDVWSVDPYHGDLVSIRVVDDLIDESDETIVLTFGTPSNAVLASPATATLMINDNDEPPVVVLIPREGFGYDMIDEDSAKQAIASLSRESGRTVTVPVSWSGQATAGADFFPSTTMLLFAPGETRIAVDLEAVRDGLDEDTEDVVVSLDAPMNATLGKYSSYTWRILDADLSPTITFELTEQRAKEDAGTLTATVKLSAPSGRQITCPVGYWGGDAIPGRDYTNSGSVAFAAGATAASVTINLIDDSTIESDESAELLVADCTNAGGSSRHAVTILDNDPLDILRDVPRGLPVTVP